MYIAIPPQAPGSFRDRISEGEERNRHCPAVREGAEFHGRTFVARGYTAPLPTRLGIGGLHVNQKRGGIYEAMI